MLQDLYRVTVYHDPEGALGTLTSIFLVFLGVQVQFTLYCTYVLNEGIPYDSGFDGDYDDGIGNGDGSGDIDDCDDDDDK